MTRSKVPVLTRSWRLCLATASDEADMTGGREERTGGKQAEAGGAHVLRIFKSLTRVSSVDSHSSATRFPITSPLLIQLSPQPSHR